MPELDQAQNSKKRILEDINQDLFTNFMNRDFINKGTNE